jgi:hypothetical protein
MRSAPRRLVEIARARRAKRERAKRNCDPFYRKLLDINGRIGRAQAKRFFLEIACSVKH